MRWLLGVGAIDARMAAQVRLGMAALVSLGWRVEAVGCAGRLSCEPLPFLNHAYGRSSFFSLTSNAHLEPLPLLLPVAASLGTSPISLLITESAFAY